MKDAAADDCIDCDSEGFGPWTETQLLSFKSQAEILSLLWHSDIKIFIANYFYNMNQIQMFTKYGSKLFLKVKAHLLPIIEKWCEKYVHQIV